MKISRAMQNIGKSCLNINEVYEQAVIDALCGDADAAQWLDVCRPDWRQTLRSVFLSDQTSKVMSSSFLLKLYNSFLFSNSHFRGKAVYKLVKKWGIDPCLLFVCGWRIGSKTDI